MNQENLRNDPRYLVESVKALEELRSGNKDDIRVSQVMAVESANRTVTAINKYLFSISSVLIPFFTALVSFDELSRNLTNTDRGIAVTSLIFLGASLVFGLLHMVTDVIFYRFWVKDQDQKLKIWSSTSFFPSNPFKIKDYIDEYDLMKTRSDKISENTMQESLHIFLFLQGLFVLASLVLILVVGVELISR